MTDKTLADIVAEMQASTTARSDRDWQKAQKAAQQSRIDEDVEAARRVAIATLDERDRRDREWYARNLGSLTPQQYRNFCRQEYGFDPQV